MDTFRGAEGTDFWDPKNPDPTKGGYFGGPQNTPKRHYRSFHSSMQGSNRWFLGLKNLTPGKPIEGDEFVYPLGSRNNKLSKCTPPKSFNS